MSILTFFKRKKAQEVEFAGMVVEAAREMRKLLDKAIDLHTTLEQMTSPDAPDFYFLTAIGQDDVRAAIETPQGLRVCVWGTLTECEKYLEDGKLRDFYNIEQCSLRFFRCAFIVMDGLAPNAVNINDSLSFNEF